ncbi:hypothetical protein Aduo_013623 [Ancylostoma duodenale]
MWMQVLAYLIFLDVPLVNAFDWGDFHKVAVIFFSFFGPGVILGAIAVVAYFACLRSWYESFRDEVRETHRSSHPWPPGSAKWQLQQYVNGKGPPPMEKLKKAPPPVPPPPPAPLLRPRLLEASAKGLLSPGLLVSPVPEAGTKLTQLPHTSQTSLQPQTSIVAEGNMNIYTGKPTSPLPLEVYCAPSATYVPYRVSTPHDTSGSTQHLSPGYTMVDKSQVDDLERMRLQTSPNGVPGQLEAVTVRTTTTTRRTTVLSPIPKRPYTIV